jgi:pimeloyl-ACP methyl ester carboxylesterase
LVIGDIVSAVKYARQHSDIDSTRIYLIGSSGGGYTALMMLGKHPDIWAGVSAWVPIADLRSWYYQTAKAGRKYARDIMNSCGGKPGESEQVDAEYRQRSPITYLSPYIRTPVDINAGIHDGHTGSVPISHSIRAFNALAQPEDKIRESYIEYFLKEQSVPVELQSDISDSGYGENQPLFRRKSENARLTIFDGGHEIIHQAAFSWLSEQQKNYGSREK